MANLPAQTPLHIYYTATPMALQTTVKISGVTNLSDARYCAGMGVAMLGFVMDETAPNYVDPNTFSAMRGWVAGVQIVGETSATDPELIEKLLTDYQPDLLQLEANGETNAALIHYLARFGKPLILRADLANVTLGQLDTLAAQSFEPIAYFLVESQSIIPLDASLIATLTRLAARYPVLLGIGLSGQNVQDVLTSLPITGIALTGSHEERPGSKDFGELMDILEVLEED